MHTVCELLWLACAVEAKATAARFSACVSGATLVAVTMGWFPHTPLMARLEKPCSLSLADLFADLLLRGPFAGVLTADAVLTGPNCAGPAGGLAHQPAGAFRSRYGCRNPHTCERSGTLTAWLGVR